MRWRWTEQAIGDDLSQEELQAEMEQTEDLRRGWSLLAALAREPGSRLQEIRPGVWLEPKLPLSTIDEV